jgi:hypothetical protein
VPHHVIVDPLQCSNEVTPHLVESTEVFKWHIRQHMRKEFHPFFEAFYQQKEQENKTRDEGED